MSGLTTTERVGDGRVILAVLAHDLETRFEMKDQLRSLQNYREGMAVPEPLKAWWLGETLRDRGASSCSGLWMLWITANYAAAVTVVAATLRNDPKKAAARCDVFWHMLGYADRLTIATRLDDVEPFRTIHVTKPAADDETVEKLRAWAVASREPDVERVYRSFLGREIAKSTWSRYDGMRDEMRVAFQEWIEDKTYIGDEFEDRLAHAALAVARADIPWPEKEFVVLVTVGNWLNAVESGLVSATYPRPLRSDLTEDDDFARDVLLGP